MTGTWTLEITDDTKGNKGKLNSWSLIVTRGVAPTGGASASASLAADAISALGVDPNAETLLRREAHRLAIGQHLRHLHRHG